MPLKIAVELEERIGRRQDVTGDLVQIAANGLVGVVGDAARYAAKGNNRRESKDDFLNDRE